MIALVNIGTGEVIGYSQTTDGIDMAGLASIAVPDGFDPMQPSHILVDGEWTPNIAFRKRQMTDMVNARAEAVRCFYLTPGSGQAITYARKEDEARAWELGADPADFPFLSAEAVATGATLADTAALVLAQADAWVTIGAAIEGNRRGLVVAIDAATDGAALDAIAPDAGWPLP